MVDVPVHSSGASHTLTVDNVCFPDGGEPWENDEQWKGLKRSLVRLPAAVKVLELCCGLGTGTWALRLLVGKARVQCAGLWDTDPKLLPVIKDLHGEQANAHIGKVAGDVTKIEVSDFPTAHVLIAGPPCPPRSSLGRRESFQDIRAGAMWRCVDVIIQQANAGSLLLFVIENVAAIAHKTAQASDTAANVIMDELNRSLSGWTVDLQFHNALDFGLPHRRKRAFIVGRLSSLNHSCRRPLHFIERVPLGMLVDTSDTDERTPYSDRQRQNIDEYRTLYRPSMLDTRRAGEWAVVEPERSAEGRTKGITATPQVDIVQCMNASGPALHIFALGCGLENSRIDRPLRVAERARLQGFPPRPVFASLTEAVARRILGNAMAVPVIGSVIGANLESMLDESGELAVGDHLSRDAHMPCGQAIVGVDSQTSVEGHSQAKRSCPSSSSSPSTKARFDEDPVHQCFDICRFS